MIEQLIVYILPNVRSTRNQRVDAVVHEIGQSVVVASEHPALPVRASPRDVCLGVALAVAGTHTPSEEAIALLVYFAQPPLIGVHTLVLFAGQAVTHIYPLDIGHFALVQCDAHVH